jgi:hypothetical protein
MAMKRRSPKQPRNRNTQKWLVEQEPSGVWCACAAWIFEISRIDMPYAFGLTPQDAITASEEQRKLVYARRAEIEKRLKVQRKAAQS